MKRLAGALKLIPARAYLWGFIIITILASAYSYIFYKDASAYDKRIAVKQKELLHVLELKDTYLAKKRLAERSRSEDTEKIVVSLGFLEEMVAKVFISGKMNMLKPSVSKQEKGKTQQKVFELKIGGAALKEVIAFMNEAESKNLFIKKLQLNIQASNPSLLDVYVVIVAGQG